MASPHVAAPGRSQPAGVRLSAAIMTHAHRLARSRRLAERFLEWDLRIACDPSPEQGPATLRTARVAWGAAGGEATHHLVIQDDVILLSSFFEHVEAAVARNPGAALAFFAEWGSRTSGAIRIAALRGASWAEVVDDYIPTQALVLPIEVARGAADFMARLPPEIPDDIALHDYLRAEGIAELVSTPNIVEHADLPSLIGNTWMGPRRATCYSAESAAAGIPGEAALLGLTCVPYYAWWDRCTECRVRPDGQATTWRKRSTRAVLADFAVTTAFIDTAHMEALGSLRHAARLVDLLGEKVLADLWLTAFALGFVAAEGLQPIGEGTMKSDTVARALHSLAPGALRNIVCPEDMDWVSHCLSPFLSTAVRMGSEC
jgi:hypothetical protein